MIAPLLVLSLALPASGQGTWLQLDAAAQLDVRNLDGSFTNGQLSGKWYGGNATIGVTVFGHRLLDDDSAPPLQAFLQRTSRFHIEGGGGGTSIIYPLFLLQSQDPNADNRYRAAESEGRLQTSAELYVRRSLQLAARVGIGYASWVPQVLGFGGFSPGKPGVPVAHTSSSELEVNAAVAMGVRWQDLLVSAGWGVTPYRLGSDAMQVRFWGGAFVAVLAVVHGFVELGGQVEVLEGGAAVEGHATVWLGRRLGLELAVEGGHGSFADSPQSYDRAGGSGGLAWWAGPRLAAKLSYSPAWQRTSPVAGLGTAISEISFVAHLITLTVTSRPPPLH